MKCKRCKNLITKKNVLVFGDEDTFKKYNKVCKKCLKEDEKKEVEEAKFDFILSYNKKGK
jgi:hypothetical protein